MLSTSQTCVRTRCRTSLVPTAVLHSYSLLVCRLHRRPAFARVAELLCYPLLSYIRTRCSYAVNIADLRSCVAEPRWYLLLSYIRTRCSYAVNTADLRSHALQRLAGAHCCSTFAPAARLPPLLLATFVRAARLPSTSSTCVGTRCRTSLVPTSVLHSYALLVCRLHRRPAFARVAEPRWCPLLLYIRTSASLRQATTHDKPPHGFQQHTLRCQLTTTPSTCSRIFKNDKACRSLPSIDFGLIDPRFLAPHRTADRKRTGTNELWWYPSNERFTGAAARTAAADRGRGEFLLERAYVRRRGCNRACGESRDARKGG